MKNVIAKLEKTHGSTPTAGNEITAMLVNKLPYVYQVEPTNLCPYSCYMCPRGKGKMKRPIGFMALETFENILKQLPEHQKMLRLHHFGESALHPELPHFIAMSRRSGISPILSLNPSTLTEGLIDKLIDSGPGIVCFSLDSLISGRLTLIRGIKKPASYCLNMIDKFINKSRLSSNKIHKVIQMVSLELNLDERQTFLKLKETYHEEDVYVYISENYGFGDIELVQETAGRENIASSGNVCCSAPYADTVILWNGDVVLCCYDYDGSNIIGNINKESLEAIWDGEKIRKIRELFDKKETCKLSYCSKCYIAPHNAGLSDAASQGRGIVEEKYLAKLFPPFEG